MTCGVQLLGRYLQYRAAQRLTKQPMRAPWLTWHGLMPGKRQSFSCLLQHMALTATCTHASEVASGCSLKA